MNLQRFPRYPLTFGPTPIQSLRRLSAHLGDKVELFAKREDYNSGLTFGDNKTRKLEYPVPETLEGGYDTLVFIDGIQSNQTRQMAAVTTHLGLKCVLVQENWVNYPDAVYNHVGDVEMSRIMGAGVRLDAADFDTGTRPSWKQTIEDVRKRGGKPFPILAGCSGHPLGGLGFVSLAEEICQQGAELGFKFDYVVVYSVTGSTQTGMVVGFAADDRADKVIGIDASAKSEQTHAQILRIAQHTAKLVDLGKNIAEKDMVLNTRYGGPEYGLPNEGTLEAIHLYARQEAMLTDPTYRGKSVHSMIDMVRGGEFPAGSYMFHAHLGGAPALSAYSFIFRNGWNLAQLNEMEARRSRSFT